MNLVSDLMEHYDYEAVNQEVWKYLFAWYCSDWSIQRSLKSHQGKMYLNLYPGEPAPLDESFGGCQH